MTTDNTTERLTSTIDRLVRLTEERAAISTDISEIYKDAEGNGYDKAALKAVVKRAIKDSAREEEELMELVDTYWTAYLNGEKQPNAA
jgi:uncharacterized protein (UPF0335 family)